MSESKKTEEEVQQFAVVKMGEVKDIQLQLNELQHALDNNPQFVQFLELQKKLKESTDAFWTDVKGQMIEKGVKKIKGDWGYITVVESHKYTIKDADKLPKSVVTVTEVPEQIIPAHTEKTVNMDKIKAFSKLKGKAPSGVEDKITYSLRKDIKEPNLKEL